MNDKLKIVLDNDSCGKIILNGKDISSNVLGLSIVANVGHVPEVTIRTAYEEGIEAELDCIVKLENEND